MFSIKIKFHYLPESLAIVFLGAVVGMFMMALPEVRIIVLQQLDTHKNKHSISKVLIYKVD